MSVDHLGAHAVGDIADVETVTRLHGDRAVHQHLEEQVAQLLAQVAALEAVDRLEHLVGLLEEIRPQTAVRLLTIPRTAARRP